MAMMSLQVEAKWIVFKELPQLPFRKTKTWDVLAKTDNSLIGQVKWYGAWRCYGFYPEPETVYEHQCLNDIARFCQRETDARRFERR